MITFRFPSNIIVSDIFDPKYFASSELNPSLGDLVLNMIAVTVLCWFIFKNIFRFRGLRATLKHPVYRWLVSIFSSVAVLFGALFPYIVIQTIYNNSAFTLNISESIQFDVMRILTFFRLHYLG